MLKEPASTSNREFSIAAQQEWNQLPVDLRSIPDITSRWPIWKKKWSHYYAELESKKNKTQISTLLTILGESAQKIYEDFRFTQKEDNIESVLEKFDKYVEPKVNKIYERCIFHRRIQEETESFEKFVNELKSMSRRCEFENITVDE